MTFDNSKPRRWTVISRKQYARMADLCAEWVADPTNNEKDRCLVKYQDEIGWPYRATQEQMDDWALRFAVWDEHLKHFRTASVNQMHKELVRRGIIED